MLMIFVCYMCVIVIVRCGVYWICVCDDDMCIGVDVVVDVLLFFVCGVMECVLDCEDWDVCGVDAKIV